MKYKDKEWLREQYRNHTQAEIADKCCVSRGTISRWLNKHNIETRGPGTAQAEGDYKNKEWLQQHYLEQERSMADIGAEFGVSKETVKYWLKKHDISIRSPSEAAEIRAEEHPHTVGNAPDEFREKNWWDTASKEEREEFREWLSEQRQGEDNPMSDKTGPDHHNWKENKPDHRFYQTKAWKEVRQEALEKANGACEACGSEEDLVGHHVVPLSAGGEPLDVENVSILCRSCHMEWEGLFLAPDRRE
jgi:transcriptional regulator with XRE-family HTH domain